MVLVAAGFFLLRKKSGNTQAVLASDTQVLEYADLESSISATGTVESSDTTKVYSTLAYQVKSVLVEVGDIVKEGDLLAELDGEQIENQIATQKTSMEVASGSAGAQVQSAYDAYDNFKQGLDAGLNASLIGAQSQVDNAYDAYVKASNAYERYKENVNLGENTQVLSAQSARDNAATALDNAGVGARFGKQRVQVGRRGKRHASGAEQSDRTGQAAQAGTRGRRRAAVGRVYHTCCGTGNASKAGADD